MEANFLSGLKRVDAKCYDIFAPYYAARAKSYIYPVFYQSITQMIASNGFFYKVFTRYGDNILVIFKRSAIMGNYSVMVHIAPISLSGSIKNELDIIKEARRLGMSAKINREDIQRYKIPAKLYTPIKGNVEYVYNANECCEMKGGKFHNFRRNVNRIKKNSAYRHLVGVNGDIENLVRQWDKNNHATRAKQQQTSQTSDWRNIKKIRDERVHVHSIYINDTLECFSVIEKLTDTQWVLVMGMRRYDSELNDVNTCIHQLDCQIAYNPQKLSVYANMGASLGIKGLSEAKEKLKPCAHCQIYKLEPAGKLNKEKVKQYFNAIR